MWQPIHARKGLDSLLSIVQMPGGVPGATVASGGGRNTGLLAVQILDASDAKLSASVSEFKRQLGAEPAAKDRKLQS
jgi:5-(carboxyamino)imidazole ribonucleotide mutase